jgi:hypothetical protein
MFKVGDIITLKGQYSYVNITFGNKYEVITVEGNWVTIYIDNEAEVGVPYRSEYFELDKESYRDKMINKLIDI